MRSAYAIGMAMFLLALMGPGGCAGGGEDATPDDQAKTEADRFQRPRQLLPDVEPLPPTGAIGGGPPPAAPEAAPAAPEEPPAAPEESPAAPEEPPAAPEEPPAAPEEPPAAPEAAPAAPEESPAAPEEPPAETNS